MGTNTLPIVFERGHYRLGGIDYENVFGIVIILDALGVKGIWKTKNPERRFYRTGTRLITHSRITSVVCKVFISLPFQIQLLSVCAVTQDLTTNHGGL
ncbi:MAG: hypothetical protein WBE34_11630 [Candidatus Nitrosopolaris sp.]